MIKRINLLLLLISLLAGVCEAKIIFEPGKLYIDTIEGTVAPEKFIRIGIPTGLNFRSDKGAQFKIYIPMAEHPDYMVQPPCLSTGGVTSFYYKAYDMKIWLICRELFTMSDLRAKTDITPMASVINYIPNFQTSGLASKASRTLANEKTATDEMVCDILESIAPGCVQEFDGDKMVNYAEVTAALIKAIQELNEMSQTQQQQIEQLKAKISLANYRSNRAITTNKIISCTPNPINNLANINYIIDSNANSAKIIIVDLGGICHKEFMLDKTLPSNQIDLSTLKAGMYYAVLVVDGLRSDSYCIIKE